MTTYFEIHKKLTLLEKTFEIDPKDPNTWPEKEQIKYVRKRFRNIRNIEHPSETVQLAAVEKAPWAIAYIQRPSEKVQLAAVRQNGLVVGSIENPSENVQLEAIRQIPLSIQSIKNPFEKVQMTAIQQDIGLILHIKNPTPFVKILKHVMNDEHLPRHQLIPFVEEALEKSKEYPFLLNILKEKGWL